MDLLTGVESAALVEGVKFLYQQAAEVLSAWRARRRDHQAPPPIVVEPPGAVRVECPRPLPDPASPEMADTLQELKDLVLEKVGSLDGDDFQQAMKRDHRLAMEYVARLLRRTVNHHGPVKRHEIDGWLHRDAVTEFQTLLAAP